MSGAKLITFDPRLSNTASMSDVWLPSWPGSESAILLSIANYLIQTDQYDKAYVEKWVNWQDTLMAIKEGKLELPDSALQTAIAGQATFDDFSLFEQVMKSLYAEFTFERAAEESQVPIERIQESAKYIANCEGKLATHTWRSASIGNLGGWQVARCLFFINVLTGSVGNRGGTAGNSWNKFTPKPFASPPGPDVWNELHLPVEWPFAHYEMSFLLPHFLEEGRGDIDVYFSRVYNPMWINPDGFMWLKQCHVALTPTWNESAWFADYVLPMGHAGERHDLMSQETHAGQWIAFRQPVRRVAKMDPDGSQGIRKWFESPYRPGEIINIDEYYQWIFENSVPGLPAAAEEEGLKPLEYMRKYGVFEVTATNYKPYEKEVSEGGIQIDDIQYAGFKTPSKKLEFFSPTMHEWGWKGAMSILTILTSARVRCYCCLTSVCPR